MEPASSVSYAGNGNGYHKAINMLSDRARLVNGESVRKASAVADAWDDCADGSETVMSNCSSGVFTPSREAESTDTEFADAESHTFTLSPSSTNPSQLLLKVHVMEALISGIFSTVSSLKKAYVQLQSAHTPLDADKLRLADRAVIMELKKLSDLKQSYKDRLIILDPCKSERQEFVTQDHVHNESHQTLTTYEAIINNFHTEIQSKAATIVSLQDKLTQMTLKKNKLEKQAKRMEQKVRRDSFINLPVDDTEPSSQLLESTVLGASEASRTFAKLLISLMKVARWDVDAAANSIEPGITYVRSSHKKYVFESYLFQRMFDEFETGVNVSDFPHSREQCFKDFLEMRPMDPDAAVTNLESPFSKFCLRRYLDLIHSKMEESFFGNLEHRNLVSGGIHPQSQFYHNFLKLSKAMWLLHLLAFSFEPTARIFQVRRETEFSPLYMESVGLSTEVCVTSVSDKVPKVAFTVMPGFRVKNVIIKCQVYILPTDIEKPR